MRFLPIVVLFLVLVTELSYGQSFYAIRRERSLIATVGAGTSTYFGELANPNDYVDARPTINAGLQYYFTNRISVRAEITWFHLKGSDANADADGRVKRNLSFVSNNFEFNATGQINLLPNALRFYQRPRVNAYAFAGIGVMYFNPKAKFDGKKYALQPLQTEGVDYSRLGLVIPYGLGVRFMVDPFLNICVEIGYRTTFTDYLDDVSTTYLDNTTLTGIRQKLADRRPEIGLPVRPEGSIRGNPKTNDGYALMTVKVEYYLPYNFNIGNSQRKLYNKKRKMNRRR